MKTTAFLMVALTCSIATFAAEEVPGEWLTVAERSDFRATSSYEETMAYLRRVEAAAPGIIRLTDFGRSAQGRSCAPPMLQAMPA